MPIPRRNRRFRSASDIPVVGIDLPVGDPGPIQRRIEPIAGAREVSADRSRPQPRVDTDEQQYTARADQVVDDGVAEGVELRSVEAHARSDRGQQGDATDEQRNHLDDLEKTT